MTAVDAIVANRRTADSAAWAQGFPWTCSDFRVIPEVPSEAGGSIGRMRRIASLVSTAILALTVGCPAPPEHSSSPRALDLASRLPALSRADGGRLGDIQWAEDRYTTRTGEPVDVAVSPSYPADQPIGQRWADFFAALPHGPELPLLEAYVAPLPEVQTICGGSAVGCYGDDQLIVTNEPALGFRPEEVARHEYGHHVALNRSNAPWPAFDWGPKRWATAAHICPRVRWNTAYPGTSPSCTSSIRGRRSRRPTASSST